MSARKRFLDEFPKAIADDAAAVFVGAGVSIGAGYPSWKELLKDIGEELGIEAGDINDLAALAQWSVRKNAGRTRINNVIRKEIAPEYDIPTPLKALARLPIRNVWTTNYDRLIERAFSEISRPLDPISTAVDLALRPRPGAVRLFKMHGSVDRLDDIVIATDDYELYRLNRGPFLPLLQAHMTSFSMLFMGLSFTDPNVRHVLSLIRESFTSSPPEHFAIVRPPQRSDFKTAKEYRARHKQHSLWSDDLLRYGLQVVEIDSYGEVDELMRSVEKRVASNRVWISGSWPLDGADTANLVYATDVANLLGQQLGDKDFALVSGGGSAIGSASIAGFLAALQRRGAWDLERRLIARPFPQPLAGRDPDRDQWSALRAEMARIAGTVVFVGGAKIASGSLVAADGVKAEMRAASAAGALLVPIGSTGGAARAIADELISDKVGQYNRPSLTDLRSLLKKDEPAAIASKVIEIIQRHARPV